MFLLLLLLTSSLTVYCQGKPAISFIETMKTSILTFTDGNEVTPTESNTEKPKDFENRGLASSSGFTEIGSGSGRLNLGTIANVNYKIKPGKYTNININKVTNCIIDGSGVKMPGGSIDLRSVNKLEIFGISISDQKYRAVSIRGQATGLNLHHFNFKNIGNNVITFEQQTIYDGTENTVNRGSKVANCTFENVYGPVSIDGSFTDSGQIKGLSIGFKFLNNRLTNCPSIGNWLSAPLAEDIEVSGNTINHINYVYTQSAPRGGHVGIFSITGNGSVHDNVCKNHQGNMVRFWGFNPTARVVPVRIFNNYVFNSWKYGAFEIQVPPFLSKAVERNKVLSYTSFEVYNNTAGQLNNSGDWEGQMLDLYNVYGPVKYYNNLGFRMNRVIDGKTRYDGITNMINYNGNGTSMKEFGNKYFATEEEAMDFHKDNSDVGSPKRLSL